MKTQNLIDMLNTVNSSKDVMTRVENSNGLFDAGFDISNVTTNIFGGMLYLIFSSPKNSKT